MYIITRNIHITTIRLVLMLPQPRPPTPASQYLSQNQTIQWLIPVITLVATVSTISYGECWVHKHPVVRMRRIELVIVGWVVWILTDTVEEKRFYWHNSSHSPWPCVTPWRWIANIFGKQRVSLRGVYVWDIKSTVTKHSDYLLWFYWLSLLETVV